MILDALEDRECLDQLTHAARLEALTERARKLALVFRTPAEVAAWLRTLPQRNNDPTRTDGPRVKCEVWQEVKPWSGDPNCVSRAVAYLAVAERIDPVTQRRLVSLTEPRHVGVVELYEQRQWRAVDLFPSRVIRVSTPVVVRPTRRRAEPITTFIGGSSPDPVIRPRALDDAGVATGDPRVNLPSEAWTGSGPLARTLIQLGRVRGRIPPGLGARFGVTLDAWGNSFVVARDGYNWRRLAFASADGPPFEEAPATAARAAIAALLSANGWRRDDSEPPLWLIPPSPQDGGHPLEVARYLDNRPFDDRRGLVDQVPIPLAPSAAAPIEARWPARRYGAGWAGANGRHCLFALVDRWTRIAWFTGASWPRQLEGASVSWSTVEAAASGAASGASTGLTVGGLWGAVVGGVVGFGAGLYGQVAGEDAAQLGAVARAEGVAPPGAPPLDDAGSTALAIAHGVGRAVLTVYAGQSGAALADQVGQLEAEALDDHAAPPVQTSATAGHGPAHQPPAWRSPDGERQQGAGGRPHQDHRPQVQGRRRRR